MTSAPRPSRNSASTRSACASSRCSSQPGNRRGRVAGVAGVDQRIPPPERQRLDQGVPAPTGRTVAQLAAAGRHQVGERRRVDGPAIDGQPIAAGDLLDRARLAERPADPGDQRLQRVDRFAGGPAGQTASTSSAVDTG